MSTDITAEIQAELSTLEADAQQRVLDYVRALKSGASGTPGTVVASFAGAIDAEELQLMAAAIQSGCEQVDLNEW